MSKKLPEQIFEIFPEFYSLHGFKCDYLSFPIVLKADNETEAGLISNYLSSDRISSFNLSAFDIFAWANAHGIKYHIFFPKNKLSLLLKPHRLFAYFVLRKYN